MSTSFSTSEGLRSVLTRLHESGPDAWQHDPEAARLMDYTISKYRPLARAHHCEPEDSAVAAFEAMRTHAVRTADDPWAVVTRAVQVSLIAEERAQGLLCSPSQARRAWAGNHPAACHLSDLQTDLLEAHPAFAPPPARRSGVEAADGVQTGAYEALDLAVALFVALGWPLDTIAASLEYIAARLVESGSRPTAHENLRRDHHARALFDLDRAAWSTLLRLVLGDPSPDVAHTAAGHGVLVLLLIGHQISELLADDGLVWEISSTAPGRTRTLRHSESVASSHV